MRGASDSGRRCGATGWWFDRRPLVLAFVVAFALFGYGPVSATEVSAGEGPTIVLVHGAWGGAWSFRETADELSRLGAVVYRPTLTGLGERKHLARPDVGLGTHVEDIVQFLQTEDLEDVVLVGHSYGGMVITGAASREESRVSRVVYVDAYLPFDGESVFGLMPSDRVERLESLAEAEGDGWRIPPYWPDPGLDVPQPIATFREQIAFDAEILERLDGAYVLTVEPGAESDYFSRFAERATQLEWPQRVMRTGHNPQRSMPIDFARLLYAIAVGETAPAGGE